MCVCGTTAPKRRRVPPRLPRNLIVARPSSSNARPARRRARSRGTSCCNGTVTAQHAIATRHRELRAALEARGWRVDVFIATYRCTNGQDYAEVTCAERAASGGACAVRGSVGVGRDGVVDARDLSLSARFGVGGLVLRLVPTGGLSHRPAGRANGSRSRTISRGGHASRSNGDRRAA